MPFSEIGQVAAFARRSGETWFLVVMNGPAARTVTIRLSFLGGGAYQAMLVRDSRDDRAAVKIEHTIVKCSDSLDIELCDGGGFRQIVYVSQRYPMTCNH